MNTLIATEDYSFAEILARIEAREKSDREAALAALPPKPLVPSLVEEPSECLIKHTAFGGQWHRRKYTDGSLSAPSFMGRGMAGPRFINLCEYSAALEQLRLWNERADAVVRLTRMLSGHARGLLNGTDPRAGNYRDFSPRTLSVIVEKAQGNSHTAAYCREIVNAAKIVGLI